MAESGEAVRTGADGDRNWWKSGWDDWWRSDRLDGMWWGLVFLWGGLVVIADGTSFSEDLDWWDGWGVFWIGAGALALVEALARLAMPKYRSKFGWTLFWGTLFLSLGLGELAGRAWHALPLVAIAVLILAGTFTRTRDESGSGF